MSGARGGKNEGLSSKRLSEPGVTPMSGLLRIVYEFIHNEIGASLGEYALLLVVITALCLGALSALGANVSSLLSALASTI